jgi:hypothetical protein
MCGKKDMEADLERETRNVRDQEDISKVFGKQCKHAHKRWPRVNLERIEDEGQRIALEPVNVQRAGVKVVRGCRFVRQESLVFDDGRSRRLS